MWANLGLVFSLLFISACTIGKSATVASGGRISPDYAGPSETSYCSTPTVYGGSTTAVNGVARYTRRNYWGNGTTGGLGLAIAGTGTHNATTLPIRRAEVRVTDPSGAPVQCAETDNTGGFSFTLPQGATTYTVSVNSRADNSYNKASVLNRPEQNIFYSLSTTVVPTGATANLGTLTAAADGTTLGGAFNILDNFLKANEYLVSTIGSTCGGYDGYGCPAFTVAPKVVAYWELGFNPNYYYGSNSGLSFYLPGYSRLFILGGVNGNTTSSDTDHFDNSVILHEYGHFIEDAVFGVSDTPGGSHNGNSVVDPRLAWSEGWGNFFQAAVLNNGLYVDTMGNDDGTTDMAYYADVESGTNDPPSAMGEGVFREFSVTRLLYDAFDTNNEGSDNVTSQFAAIWAAVMKSYHGLRTSSLAFRNIGHLHMAQIELTGTGGATSWSNLRTMENQYADTTEYAQYRTTGSSCAATTITPSTGGDFGANHMFKDNDFYHIKISSTNTYTFLLKYNDTAVDATNLDLDLYLYNETADFGDSSSLKGYSNGNPSGTTNQQEQISVSLTPGDYLLNVSSYSGSPQTGQYEIRQGGLQLCPGTL